MATGGKAGDTPSEAAGVLVHDGAELEAFNLGLAPRRDAWEAGPKEELAARFEVVGWPFMRRRVLKAQGLAVETASKVKSGF